jgi:ElaB/YqjD/DUF883 family membrane-anchored ribosome-binding protein
MPNAKTADKETGFEKAVDRVRDNVKDFAASAGETAADTVGSAADFSADSIKSVARTVPQAQEWVGDGLDRARDAIREKPIKTMAIAAGIGAVLGLIFLR